ncbi:MAG: peptidyl-prolyl cis-trans isomerase [Myxococcota bacterium]
MSNTTVDPTTRLICKAMDLQPHHPRPLLMAVLLLMVALGVGCEAPNKRAGELSPRDIQALQDDKEVTVGDNNATSRLTPEQQRLVVAMINGKPLTLGEYERRLNAQPPFVRARYSNLARKSDFLTSMIQFEILADHAQKLGYDTDPDVVLNLKQAMVRKMRSDELDKRVSLGDITDEAVRNYYEAHKSDYIRPEKVRVSQIVLPTEEAIQTLITELEAAFADDPTHKRKIFGTKAREVSIDAPTAERSGDMNFFARPTEGGTVDPTVSKAAFALTEVGQLSPPIQTERGWHLLMLTGRKQAFKRELSEVERSIANRLYRERRALAEQQFIDEARSKASVTLHEDVLNTIPDPEPDPNAPDNLSPHNHGDETPRRPTPTPPTE